MTVRVLTKRTVIPAHRARVLEILRQLRAQAWAQAGYSTGQVLQEISDPNEILTTDTCAEVELNRNRISLAASRLEAGKTEGLCDKQVLVVKDRD